MCSPYSGSLPAGERNNGRWYTFDYEELIKQRDNSSLDIFWLKGKSLPDSDNLPAPDVIAQEIVDDLEAALAQFREILNDVDAFSKGGERL